MKSLELNWIRKYDKSLIIPEVVFSSLSWVAGQYYKPDNDEIYIDGVGYSMRFGLIEVSERQNKTDVDIASTLAHEWRHHWQIFNLPTRTYNYYWPHEFDNSDYDDMIIKYFTSNELEMDALRFQKKYSSVCDEWESVLYLYL